MIPPKICCICRNAAIQAAAGELLSLGLDVVFTPNTECSHLLLPIPSFPAVDNDLHSILERCSKTVTISGGNLNRADLSAYHTVDFLKDPDFLAENAAITARCAIRLSEQQGITLNNKRILILGFGRIAKYLCHELTGYEAEITVAARKAADLAAIRSLGFHAVPIDCIAACAEHSDLIFNTIPAMVLFDWNQSDDTIAIELASVPGMVGRNILSARGLPAKMAPEESGMLIAKTFVRISL